MSGAKRLAVAMSATLVAQACFWDNPVWPKSNKSDTPLFRFTIKEKDGTGYIDRDGNVVIPPTLSNDLNYGEDDFFEGLALVRKDGKSWYIDRTGKQILRGYWGSKPFSEGLARVWQDKKTGFIDRAGELVIPIAFDIADDFSEGVAAVRVGDLYGYIDHKGRYVVRPKFNLAMTFSDGVARVIEEGDCYRVEHGPCPGPLPRSGKLPRCLYSFIDHRGARLFENRYPDAKDFSEGLAPVGDGYRWGYIDKSGKTAIPLQFEDAEPFAEGLARVRFKGKVGFIDKKGNIVIPAVYTSGLDFSEGLAVVYSGGDKCWFIDKQGHQAIPKTFLFASSFVMGRAHTRNGMDYRTAIWSYIDHTGRAVFTYSDQSTQKPR